MKKKLSKEQAIRQLWEMGELSWKLKGKQKDIYDYITNQDNKISCVLISRRFGKCVAEGTQIPTTNGLKNIEDIVPGDFVYGYNEDGNIEPTEVKQLHYQGEKEVYDLKHSRKVYATVTDDHRFLTYNPVTEKETVKRLGDMYGHEKIRREFIETQCGDIYEPQAYAVGALLGDGCSRQGKHSIHISGQDEEVVLKVKSQLNASYHYKQNDTNYTWVISNNEKLSRRGYFGKRNVRPHCSLYEEWCSEKYAHEKFVDLDIVKRWDRKSCLDFLAGIIDTDGSVHTQKNILTISIHSQSSSILEACQFLIKQLFLVDCTIYEDKRSKYKNGNVFFIQLKNNLHSKRILKELDQFIQVPRKKWKNEYSLLLENNSNEKFIGVKKVNKRTIRCWDIGIDNGTHLYVMQNGLITHNSFVNCIYATETCLKNPGSIVKYACPQQRMVKTIIKPIMRIIFQDAPKEINVNDLWHEQDKTYRFPNGSEIQIAGTDNGNAENLRGGYANLLICDEAGFMDDLDYVIKNILLPTTDTTDGSLIMTSTPNYKDPLHEFHEHYVFPFEAEGKLLRYTVYDSPMVNDKKREEIISRYPGGADNPQFKCEYMCEIPRSSELTVVPEFTKELQGKIITEIEKPPFYDPYVSMDVGFRDLTGALFGYYDFREARLVILDELVMNGPEMTTAKLAEQIDLYEERHFFDEKFGERKTPYLRIMDNDLKLINDLAKLHNMIFIATKKDNKEAAVNDLRMWIHQERILIHPRCKHLIYHLEHGMWDKTRKKFKHLKDSPTGDVRGGHADLLDALIYLVRNIVSSKNPYPDNYGRLSGNNVVDTGITRMGKSGKIADFMKTIMNINRKTDK